MSSGFYFRVNGIWIVDTTSILEISSHPFGFFSLPSLHRYHLPQSLSTTPSRRTLRRSDPPQSDLSNRRELHGAQAGWEGDGYHGPDTGASSWTRPADDDDYYYYGGKGGKSGGGYDGKSTSRLPYVSSIPFLNPSLTLPPFPPETTRRRACALGISRLGIRRMERLRLQVPR